MPNEQWDDFALTREFTEINRRISTYEDSVRGLAHFPIDVATAALNIEHLTQEVGRVAESVAEVKRECRQIRKDWQGSIDERRKGRTAIIVAVIAGSATILAAIVALVAQVAGG